MDLPPDASPEVEAFVTRAAFDSNIVIGGAIWRGESHLCLVAMARRRVRVFTSPWIIEEVRRSVRKLQLP